MTLYFVTHRHSAPSKRNPQWDFLAVSNNRQDAEHLKQELNGSGIIQRKVPTKEVD